MTALAMLAGALAGWLWFWPVTLGRLSADGAGRRPRRIGRPWVVAAALAVGAAVLTDWAIGLCGAAVTAAAVWGWRRHRRRRQVAREQAEVVRSTQLLSGMLRLGLVPVAALAGAAARAPMLAEAAAVQAMGGSAGPVLRVAAAAPGREGLADVARAWELAEQTGASMATTLDAVAGQLARASELRDTVEAELSAARATGRLLAVLPVAGLALGYLLGGDPLGFLTGSLPGRACLVAGVALGCAGLVWTELLADRHGG